MFFGNSFYGNSNLLMHLSMVRNLKKSDIPVRIKRMINLGVLDMSSIITNVGYVICRILMHGGDRRILGIEGTMSDVSNYRICGMVMQ